MINALRCRAGGWPRLLRGHHSRCAAIRGAVQRIEIPVRDALERRRLELFRDRHCGAPCFVIGNGRALQGRDLGPLAGETTFVANHFYFHAQLDVLHDVES